MREPTEEEAFKLRRAAWIILSTDLRADGRRIARMLNGIADDLGAPPSCEGCGAEATTSDDEGVDLCEDCVADLIGVPEEQAPPHP